MLEEKPEGPDYFFPGVSTSCSPALLVHPEVSTSEAGDALILPQLLATSLICKSALTET